MEKKVLLKCGHCMVVTSKITNLKCPYPVRRTFPCGHTRTFPCFTLDSGPPLISNYRCHEIVEVFYSCKRHKYMGVCYESENRIQCGKPCGRILPCNHPCNAGCHEVSTNASSKSESLANNKDCPSCLYLVNGRLSCGHEVELPCHQTGKSNPPFQCREQCKRIIVCGHQCKKLCYEPCSPCTVIVAKPRSGVCPHRVYVECFEDPYDAYCLELVPAFPQSPCGHQILVHCGIGKQRNFLSNRELLQNCEAVCGFILSCGHLCPGLCKECLNGRFHARCQEMCEIILPCGHKCAALCSEPCPPCQKECENYCVHGPCLMKCGQPCEDCPELCLYACVHSECTNRCGEPCNMKPCDQPCPYNLVCGHACMGFCGEPCPPACFICEPEKLEEGNFLNETISEMDRYIVLPDCGHVIESNSMEGWMNAKKEQEEITPICCPLCRKVIRDMRKYSHFIINNRKDIELIGITIRGNIDENETERLYLIEDIHEDVQENFPGVRHTILDFLTDKSFYTKAELDCAKAIWNFCVTANKMIKEIKEILSKNRVEHLEKLYGYLFSLLEMRNIPLTNQESLDINRELTRVRHAVEIQKRNRKDQTQAIQAFLRKPCALEKFDAIYNQLLHPVPYTYEREKEFLEKLEAYDKLINVSLNISEEDRRSIVFAFGNQSGRWFKCKRGHIYVITECGGAIERGVCNECGESIGGIHHRTDEGNVLATEMDGAEKPLFPNSVQILEFD